MNERQRKIILFCHHNGKKKTSVKHDWYVIVLNTTESQLKLISLLSKSTISLKKKTDYNTSFLDSLFTVIDFENMTRLDKIIVNNQTVFSLDPY